MYFHQIARVYLFFPPCTAATENVFKSHDIDYIANVERTFQRVIVQHDKVTAFKVKLTTRCYFA